MILQYLLRQFLINLSYVMDGFFYKEYFNIFLYVNVKRSYKILYLNLHIVLKYYLRHFI